MLLLGLFAAALTTYALVGYRLERIGISRPMMFVGAGVIDADGAVLGALVFFILGLTAVELFEELTWQLGVYALLSLTLIRMVSVAVALVGSGLRGPTVAFIGWFGPRGLASVVLALVVLNDDQQLSNVDTLVLATLLTVIGSVVAHGITASPLSRRYGRWAATLSRNVPADGHADRPQPERAPGSATRGPSP
jgi:NhaP-type Na+/H+ or K+/H+ antiporter